jgi:hypothetical protein
MFGIEVTLYSPELKTVMHAWILSWFLKRAAIVGPVRDDTHLNWYTEVVTVFYSWNQKRYPHLHLQKNGTVLIDVEDKSLSIA